MESTSPTAGSINYAKAKCMAASNALSQYYVHSCSVATHVYNVFEILLLFVSYYL